MLNLAPLDREIKATPRMQAGKKGNIINAAPPPSCFTLFISPPPRQWFLPKKAGLPFIFGASYRLPARFRSFCRIPLPTHPRFLRNVGMFRSKACAGRALYASVAAF